MLVLLYYSITCINFVYIFKLLSYLTFSNTLKILIFINFIMTSLSIPNIITFVFSLLFLTGLSKGVSTSESFQRLSFWFC